MELLVVTSVLIGAFVRDMDAVTIAPAKKSIMTSDTDAIVVLPCNFSTRDYPQITWYPHTDGNRDLVVQRNMDGRHRISRDFRDRVGFGNRGDLILIQPVAADSGHYSCEVEVDHENPVWAKVEMDLKVVRVEKPAVLTTPPENVGFCGESISVLQFVLVVFGFVMAITSTLLIADSMYSVDDRAPNDNLKEGLATGIAGNIILIVTAILVSLKERIFNRYASTTKYHKGSIKTESGLEENSSKKMFEDGAENIPLKSPDLQDYKAERIGNETSSSSCQAEEKVSIIKTLKNPSEETVIGMVSISYKDVYFCTKSNVFYKDVEKVDQSYITLKTPNHTGFVMITKSKSGVVVSIPDKKNMLFDDKTQLLVIEYNGNMAVLTVDIASVRPWVCIDPGYQRIYITDFEGGRVVSIDYNGLERGDIGRGVLRNPVSVVQNSSGFLIVADSAKSDLFMFEKTGNFVTTVKISMSKSQENEMKGCDKLTLSKDGRIFASSPFSKNVTVFSPDFRFESFIPTAAESSGVISSLMVENNLLYVAYEQCVRIYPV